MNEQVVAGKTRQPLGFYWHFNIKRGPLGRALGLQDDVFTVHNALLDEGERDLLNVYFRASTVPTAFYLGLNSGSLTETQNLANVVEPSQSGYVRQQISSFGAPALSGGDMQTAGSQVTFTAAATWTPVDEIFLASTSAGAVGSVILTAALSTRRSLVSQDQLNCTLSVKAS